MSVIKIVLATFSDIWLFLQERYEMYASEAAPVGSILGKIKADDSDLGENAAMDYVIEGDTPHIVRIVTNNETQEGTVILNKVRRQPLLDKEIPQKSLKQTRLSTFACYSLVLLVMIKYQCNIKGCFEEENLLSDVCQTPA